MKDQVSASMYLDSPVTADNKALFDALYERRANIEQAFGGPLKWLRLDDRSGDIR